MPSPLFRAAGALATAPGGSPSSVSVPLPAGVVQNDFMLLVVRTSQADSTPVPPTGWTYIPSFQLTSGFQSDFQVYYKIAGASEPSGYTVSNDGNPSTHNGFIAQILAWQSATFDVSATYTGSSSTTTIPCPSVTMTGANQTLICLYGQYGISTIGGPYTAPSGMTARSDQQGAGTSFGVADLAISASGATAVQNATATDGSNWNLAISIGIASVSVGTSVNPGAGSLTITGYAPTVTQNGPQSVNPGAGTLTITGYAPTVAQSGALNTAVNPGVGSLTITGYAPTVARTTLGTVTTPSPLKNNTTGVQANLTGLYVNVLATTGALVVA